MFTLRKSLKLDGILGAFTKALKDLDKFVDQGEKKVGVINAKIDVAQSKADRIKAELDKAAKAKDNIKAIIGE